MNDDGILVASGVQHVVSAIGFAAFAAVIATFTLVTGRAQMLFVLLLAVGAGATAVYGALALAYKSVLFPDGRLEFHRLAGCRRTSVEVVRHVKHRKREGGGREFRIAFDGGAVVIVANEAGRRLVNTLTMRNRSIELVGYTRWDW